MTSKPEMLIKIHNSTLTLSSPPFSVLCNAFSCMCSTHNNESLIPCLIGITHYTIPLVFNENKNKCLENLKCSLYLILVCVCIGQYSGFGLKTMSGCQ